MTQPPENAELAVKANPMQDNPIQLLRDASERATPGPWKAGEPAWFRGRTDPADGKRPLNGATPGVVANIYGEANAELIVAAVNYVRSILNSPDEAAVERAELAICEIMNGDEGFGAGELARAALTAALGAAAPDGDGS